MAMRQPGRPGELRAELVERRRSAARARTRTTGSERSRAESSGAKRRLRPESFADHYSQARQFYVSQTPIEQQHIGDAFVFELSKVERADIRERMVANLRNVDEDLAATRRRRARARRRCPTRANAAAARRSPTSPPSPALSILRNPPGHASPAARSACSSPTAPTPSCSRALEKAVDGRGRALEFVAPKVGGVDDRRRHARRGRPEDRRRPVGALRRRGRSSRPRPAPRSWRPSARGQGLRRRRVRALQVHRLHAGAHAAARPRRHSRYLMTAVLRSSERVHAAAFVEACHALRLWTRVGAAH